MHLNDTKDEFILKDAGGIDIGIYFFFLLYMWMILSYLQLIKIICSIA